MKIIHVSFAVVKDFKEPFKFLDKIKYFIGILKVQASSHAVISTHCINFSGELKKDGALFKFFRISFLERIFPFQFEENTDLNQNFRNALFIHEAETVALRPKVSRWKAIFVTKKWICFATMNPAEPRGELRRPTRNA